ncbi:hypothetical protein DMC47_17995 [Nostoc sp. 3335mG]|nr:hypothetical protein DMC47_17995 [Nostoc sp. 3335mG]
MSPLPRARATRWLLSAAFAGQWTSGQWTFSPAARLSYFEETSEGYADSLGVFIPSVTAGLGQFALGPRISYRFDLDSDVVIDAGLRFEGVVDIVNSKGMVAASNAHGRVEGSLGVNFGSGLTLGASVTYDSIGSQATQSLSGKLTLQSAMP